MSEHLNQYLNFAREMAWEAGRLTLGYFQTDLRPDWKEDDTPVTVADKKAEELIRHHIETRFPTHDIIGEEYGDQNSGASHRWIIDPIDGTKSFIRGVPLYGVLIGLVIEDRPVLGVANFPALGEMISAGEGLGCWWNGRRAAVSDKKTLAESVVSHIDTASFELLGKGEQWQRLQRASYYNAGWCDAYGYLLVATGRVEVALDPIMNVWDCAPFLPILQEAGGYFGDWQGNPVIDAGEALATNGHLLPELLHLFGNPE
ncbi:MAG: inositol monophosphatase family protein [Ardenticatenaceae bacterium]|nr:inositol monophosphatase family protein [Ardenticatenaceae bacterium]